MLLGIPQETFPGERRVALAPALTPMLAKAGFEVVVQSGAGLAAGFTDQHYLDKGARIAAVRAEVFAADVVLLVRALGANPDARSADLDLVRAGQTWIAFCEPLAAPEPIQSFAARGGRLFAMELIPRTTRAQSMDALSSMATLAGYKAVLLAAGALPKMFRLRMTAAGTISPAKVFVIGAGVAGLQAIATAKRLGAVIEAYDVRPAVKEQVQSVGAKFLDLPLETADAQTAGGYAKALDESFYRRQRELMTRALASNDVVITTAAIPGKQAPVLITAEMVTQMTPGSVIVDLAAERGGNCELTQPGTTVVHHGVTILGPVNLPSELPFHASQLYAKNATTLLMHLVKDKALHIDMQDEITRETLVTADGQVVHPRVRDALGLALDKATG